MTGATVRCRGLVQIFPVGTGQVAALSGIDLDVAPGEQVALIGPSGSGKSTLLGLLAGVLRPSAGQLSIDDHDLTRAGPAELQQLRASRIGTMLQGGSRNLLGYATATSNIAYARRALRRSHARPLPPAAALLHDVGIDAAVAHRPVATLSGGERQRVALAVALANGPGLLLVDEPTSDLDAVHRDQVMQLLTATTADLGCTTVVVTHDAAVAAMVGRRITVRDGRVDVDSHRSAADVVVDASGRLPLPPDVLADWPVGTRVQVHPDRGSLRITRADP